MTLREGFYRLNYDKGEYTSIGVITLHDGVLSGCDPHYFMHGLYKKTASKISGQIVFERHTDFDGQGIEAQVFSIVFSGVCGSHYGTIEFSCPDCPSIKGRGKFHWLGKYQK